MVKLALPGRPPPSHALSRKYTGSTGISLVKIDHPAHSYLLLRFLTVVRLPFTATVRGQRFFGATFSSLFSTFSPLVWLFKLIVSDKVSP